MTEIEIPLLDLEATAALAKNIASKLHKGDVVTLRGDLGVGKTAFARALLQALGVTGDIPSPTFTLLQTYEVNELLISHFDLYRLKSSDELDEIGWDDALSDGLTLIEWPERADKRIPQKRLELNFSVLSDGQRICRISEIKNP